MNKRGYLLLEAALGGAVMVLIFGACLAVIASERSKVSYGARAQIAAEIATARLGELQSQPTFAAISVPLAAVDPVNYPGIRAAVDVVDVTAAFGLLSPLQGTLFEINVRVEHPSATGPEIVSLRSLRRIP